jgi:hypothetical protein
MLQVKSPGTESDLLAKAAFATAFSPLKLFWRGRLTCKVLDPSGRHIKAVLWDFGGVLTTSPFEAFAAYERDHGLPAGFIRRLNATNPDTNAWAGLERGHLDMAAFAAAFEAEARAAGAELDARAVMSVLGGQLAPSHGRGPAPLSRALEDRAPHQQLHAGPASSAAREFSGRSWEFRSATRRCWNTST